MKQGRILAELRVVLNCGQVGISGRDHYLKQSLAVVDFLMLADFIFLDSLDWSLPFLFLDSAISIQF